MKTIQDFPSEEKFIRWIFRDRCIICWMKAEAIHEINPRSSGKESMEWKNRITLCNGHHQIIHHKGIDDEMIKYLQKERMIFLVAIGRNNYV